MVPAEILRAIAIIVVSAPLLSVGTPASAHCDGLDGPVVAAARSALESGEISRALIWVGPDAEAEIRTAFGAAMNVRKLGPEARDVADRSFYETLVRVHRAGEGAPYTGLKPAGRDLGPAIPAADAALATGSEDALVRLLAKAVEDGVRARFATLMERKRYSTGDVSAGREFVEAYVTFIHYAERIHEAAQRPSEGHYAED
jgi:hypothetical protein